MNTVKLTDNHLRVINAALETYFRLKTGQVDIALDYAYDFKIDRQQVDAIGALIKSIVMPEIASRGSSYGFNAPQIGDGRIAYEIKKTFEEVLAVKNNDGYYGYTVDFHGPLKASDEPLPEVVDFKNYIDYKLDKKQSKKVNKLLNNKKFEEAWDYVDSLKLDLPKGEKVEIIPSFECVTIRVTKPRKPEKEIEQNS
jgi:hypothetical protein